MTKAPKIFLGASLATFAVGLGANLVSFEVPFYWHAALPLSGVFFELFLITLFLQGESAQFSAEQELRQREAEAALAGTQKARPSANYVPSNARPVVAH